MDPESVDIFLNNILSIVFSIVVFLFTINVMMWLFLGFDLCDVWSFIISPFSKKQKNKNKKRKKQKKQEEEMEDYGL